MNQIIVSWSTQQDAESLNRFFFFGILSFKAHFKNSPNLQNPVFFKLFMRSTVNAFAKVVRVIHTVK